MKKSNKERKQAIPKQLSDFQISDFCIDGQAIERMMVALSEMLRADISISAIRSGPTKYGVFNVTIRKNGKTFSSTNHSLGNAVSRTMMAMITGDVLTKEE